MTGEAEPNPFGGSGGAFSTTIRKGLDEAADDGSVKAVVLRVDSPGGSALASEIIYDAVQRVRAKGKPVVVSMGNVAASGGYYVSCGADHIFADPTTITASIGVVGGKMVTTGMWDWMGITWHPYQRGENADIMTSAKPWDEQERAKILDWMNEVYAIFKGHITDHRGKKLTKPIDEMAGGRVYTGRQALDLGLVDEMGGLNAAIKKAADLATIGDYELRVLPKPKGLFDFIREAASGEDTERISIRAGAPKLFGMDSPILQTALPVLSTLDPQRTKALHQALIKLQLMHEEHVVLMSPLDWVLRWN
jgi:protease-4